MMKSQSWECFLGSLLTIQTRLLRKVGRRERRNQRRLQTAIKSEMKTLLMEYESTVATTLHYFGLIISSAIILYSIIFQKKLKKRIDALRYS